MEKRRNYTVEDYEQLMVASAEALASRDVLNVQAAVGEGEAAPSPLCPRYQEQELAAWKQVRLYEMLIWILAVAAGARWSPPSSSPS